MGSMPLQYTLKCLKIGTPKIINFPFVPNGKLMYFRCPSIQADCNEAVIYLHFGTPKIMNFPFGTNGKFIILGVPILKHIRVTHVFQNLLPSKVSEHM